MIPKSVFRLSSAHRFSRLALAFAAAGLFAIGLLGQIQPAQAAAGVNNQMNFQGRLLTATGAVVPDGNYNFEFKIYQDGDGQTAADATGSPAGSLKWTEDWFNNASNGVVVKNGYFSVSLGSITSLSTIDFNQSVIWLSMNVGGTTVGTPTLDGEMLPMKRLAASPYALNSAALGGLSASSFLQIAQGVQTDASTAASLALNKTNATGNILDLQRGGADVMLINNAGQTLFRPQTDAITALQVQKAGTTTDVFDIDTANGRVGINTGAPAYPLDVVGSINTDTSLKVAGTDVCTSSGCTPNATSNSFIQNQTATPQSASFSITGTATIGGNLTAQGGTTTLGNTTTGGTLTIQGKAGTSNPLTIDNSSTSNPTLTLSSAGDRFLTLTNTGAGTFGLSVQGTYNTNTFTSSGLTFGAASGASINAASTQALAVDSGTTGALNLGTSANAHTITIGNGTGATSVVINNGTGALNIGTNATAHATTVGSTNSTSATTLQGGTGGVAVTSTNSTLALTSGTGAISIGTDTTVHTVTIGSGTGASSVVINTGTGALNVGTNATAHATTVGSTNSTSSTTLQGGTGGVSILATNSTLAISAGTGAINIGNDSANKTITLGVSGSTANTTTVNVATSTGAAQTVNVGSSNAGSAVTLQGGATSLSVANSGVSVTGAVTASGVISTTAGGAAGTGTQALASNSYVQSRGTNLVTNGSGLLGNNYNFSSFSFDPINDYAGGGSFKNSSFSANVTNDELIPVDPSRYYNLSLWANSTTHVSGSHEYFGIQPIDIDGNTITPSTVMYQPSTTTTLASALHPGDTTISLTSAANWNNVGGSTTSTVIVWGYTNGKGYTYPDNTYSRREVNNAYSTGGVNYGTNTITLTSPWPATWGTISAGTSISNGSSSGSFKYIAASNVDVPNAWTHYQGTIGGTTADGTFPVNQFPAGTAYVQLVFLMNRDVAGNTTNVSDISLTDNTPQPNTVYKATSSSDDSTNYFQIQGSSSATSVLDVDTQNKRIGIGTNTPGYSLDVQGGQINASGGFVANGTSGSSVTCSSGNVLQNPVVSGGIITGGTCITNGLGITLQNAYTSSTGGTTPEIVLDATRGALTVRDASTPLGANLFEVQNNAGSTTYFGVTATGASVTGTLASSGALTVTSGGAAITGTLAETGNLTVSGTTNTNTFTGSALTFGTAGTAAIAAASGQQLTVDAGTTATLGLGTSANNKTINIGVTGATANTTAINLGVSTGAAQTITAGSTNTSSQVTLQGGAASLVVSNTGSSFTGNVNATTGFKFNGTAGSTTTCSSGNVLQNAVVQGGIITSGTCVANGGGVAPMLQDAYNNSTGGTTPEIKLDATRGGLDIQDANSSIGANLLTVRASNGSGLGSALFAVNSTGQTTLENSTDSSAAFQIQNHLGTDILTVDSTLSQLVVRGIGDNATIGSELMTGSESFPTTTGWTAISGVGASATATHSSGTTTLTPTPGINSPGSGKYYQIVFTVSGRTAGNVTAIIGGQTGNAISANGTDTEVIKTSGTGNFGFQPTSAFNGTVTGVSVMLLTQSNAQIAVRDASGLFNSIEVRTNGTSGSTFVGQVAGQNSQSSANFNTGIGSNALANNVSGDANTAIGNGALGINVIGNNNTALGVSALGTNTSGSNNTALGYNSFNFDSVNGSFTSLATLTNATTIGYNSQAQASNSLILGGAGSSAVNVGIGTTSPTNLFSISPVSYSTGTASQAGTTVTGSGTTWTSAMVGSEIVFQDGDKATITAFTNTTHVTVSVSETEVSQNYRIHLPALQVTSSGTVGIGTLTPGYQLDVQGGQINASGGFVAGGTSGSSVTCSSGNVLSNQVVVGGIITGGTCATNGGGISPTLQQAYTNTAGATPEIVVDATRGALTIRDASSAIGSNLLEVQNNAGTTTYLGVSATGASVTGTLISSGALTVSSGGATVAGGLTVSGGGAAITGTLAETGNLTVSGTINSSTLTSSALTFGAASTAAIAAATGQQLTLDAGSTASLGLGTSSNNKTINVGVGGTTANTTTINLGVSTGAAQTINAGSTNASSQVTLQGGAGALVVSNSGSTFTGNVNATTGYKFNGTAGSTTTCSSGNVLQNAVVQGGIITSGTCVANGGGVAPTLQNTYDNSSTTPLITLSATGKGVFISDASTTVGGNLFAVQNNAATTQYLAVTTTGLSVTGTTTTSGALTVTSGGAAITGTLAETGNLTVSGTINSSTLTSSALTFGAASTAAIQAATGQQLTLDAGSTAALGLGTSSNNKTINLGVGGTTANTTTINLAVSTGAAQTINAGSTNASSQVTLQGGAAALVVSNSGSSFTGSVNASTGFKFNGTGGSTTTCTSGNVLQNSVIQGGIITAGTCVANGGGVSPTLQNVYDNSSSPASILLADAKNFVITAADTATDPNVLINLQCVTSCSTNGRFAVQNAGSDVFVVNPNGTVVVGTATNGMSISSGGEPTLNGTGRHTRRIELSPEFAGATMTPDSGCSTCSGTMTSDNDIASPFHNFYNWTTTQVANQHYDIWVRVPIPSDFSAWSTGSPDNPTIFTYAKTSNTTNGTVQIATYDSSGTSVQSLTSVTPGSTNTWTETSVHQGTGSFTYTAGGYITLQFRVQAPTSGNTKLGEIRMDYLSKW